jgi:hypothetical protein
MRKRCSNLGSYLIIVLRNKGELLLDLTNLLGDLKIFIAYLRRFLVELIGSEEIFTRIDPWLGLWRGLLLGDSKAVLLWWFVLHRNTIEFLYS